MCDRALRTAGNRRDDEPIWLLPGVRVAVRCFRRLVRDPLSIDGDGRMIPLASGDALRGTFCRSGRRIDRHRPDVEALSVVAPPNPRNSIHSSRPLEPTHGPVGDLRRLSCRDVVDAELSTKRQEYEPSVRRDVGIGREPLRKARQRANAWLRLCGRGERQRGECERKKEAIR